MSNANRFSEKNKNKYNYLYVIQRYYSYGWEDLTAAEQTPKGRAEMRADLKAYRENAPEGSYRLIKRRERHEGAPTEQAPK